MIKKDKTYIVNVQCETEFALNFNSILFTSGVHCVKAIIEPVYIIMLSGPLVYE